jgi:response regulator RpfG family c-di-GMP phosphodiesterase
MSKVVIRRPRAVIIDDDIVIMALLRTYFHLRGYDVLTYREPRVCPLSEEDTECRLNRPCADIMLVDFSMPRMNGIEILSAQSAKKCKLTAKNKALITGYSDLLSQSIIDELSCAFFEKPLDFNLLAAWFDECEKRIDLSQPLGIKRKEQRHPCNTSVRFMAQAGPDILNGTAINMSTSGLCLQINRPLLLEQTITIVPSQVRPSWRASVKWLKDIGNGNYVAGLHHQ